MRRSRLSVKPNIGGPKLRAIAPKPVPVESTCISQTTEESTEAKGDLVKNLQTQSAGSSNASESTVINEVGKGTSVLQTVEDATETKVDKPKPTRRVTAKPKPNIPGRGSIRSKITDSVTTESDPAPKDSFTTIKPAHIESSLEKRIEEGPSESGNETNKAVSDKSVVTQENKIPAESGDKDTPTNKQRFRSRFAKARPNIEAVSRPRIR